jgi:hypothetical protein
MEKTTQPEFRSVVISRNLSRFPPIPIFSCSAGTKPSASAFPRLTRGERNMRKSLIVAALIGAVATPVFADDIGDQYRDGEGTPIIKEREAHDSATVIKKEDADANREAAVIHQDDHN